MKCCSHCRNDEFKQVFRRYVIKTRHTLKPEIEIENLAVNECKICGNITVPESSEKIIELLRKKVREEMEEMSYQHEQSASGVGIFKEVVRKFIG